MGPDARGGFAPPGGVWRRTAPAFPAVGPPPADAGIGAITAPIPSRARPSVGVPAVRLAAVDELRRFGERKIGRDRARRNRRRVGTPARQSRGQRGNGHKTQRHLAHGSPLFAQTERTFLPLEARNMSKIFSRAARSKKIGASRSRRNAGHSQFANLSRLPRKRAARLRLVADRSQRSGGRA